MDHRSIVCITETQKKIRDVNFNNNIVIIEGMREMKDRKGGGLMVLYQRNKDIVFTKVDTKSKDILHVKGLIREWDLAIVVVY